MFRKIGTFILMVLYLTFSSGIVVFAFECECATAKHSHFSLLKNVDCTDFDCHSDAHSSTNKCECNEQCDAENQQKQGFIAHNKQNEKQAAEPLIKTKCGLHSVKIFKLSNDVVKTFVPSLKFMPEFSQIDLMALKTTYKFINQNFNNIFLAKIKQLEKNILKSKDPQLIIVEYIHSQTAVYYSHSQSAAYYS